MNEAKWAFFTELLKQAGPWITALLAWLMPSPFELKRRRDERRAAEAAAACAREEGNS